VFQPEPPALATLTKSVKAAFDPLALFNPGRMFERV
jgi:FAD/FMN-containing dehydrogenase